MSMPPSIPSSVTGIILAAGRGSRMRSRQPKAIHCLLGKPLVHFPVELFRSLGVGRVVVVVGPDGEPVRSSLGETVEYAVQERPLGTADAAGAALQVLEGAGGTALVLPVDCPLLTADSLTRLLSRHSEPETAATCLTKIPPQQGILACIISTASLARALRETRERAGGETDLEAILARLSDTGERVEYEPVPDPSSAVDVNDRVDLAEAASILRAQVLRRHMLGGVTIDDPAATYIDADVEIGQDTVIRPMTWLCGKTIIGEECEIGPSVRITNCLVGDRVSAQSAVMADSEIGEGSRIGPFAQLRPGCKIGRKVKIGNFVELKNAEVEDQASMGHLAYIGDAFVGERSNIGAGTITCNYDGKRKHRTQIGKRTFIGSHTTLIAPVDVADGAFVAAGTVVNQNVPEDALAIGRSQQVTKADWARKWREREK
jgi:bifunctional UDP-N-acetylglucosamine pyrophosphorylase / glucosamine-1-phosphate N-acetyltransferase